MAGRSRKPIQTNRAQIVVNPTEIRKPALGTVTLTGGSSGNVSSITVNSIEVLGATITYSTSLAYTASLIADQINAYVSSPNYYAVARDVVIEIFQAVVLEGSALTVAVTSSTITTSKTDVDGAQYGDGDALGYTREGCDVDWNDNDVEFLSDELGAEVAKVVFIGGTVNLSFTALQYDQDVLRNRFTGRFDDETGVIEFPGTLVAGSDAEDNAVIIELRPDDTRHTTVYARNAVIRAIQGEPTRYRTSEAKQVRLRFSAMPDDSIGAEDARYPSRILAVGPAYNIAENS